MMKSLYNEWFSNEAWWFPCTDGQHVVDKIVTNRFASMIGEKPIMIDKLNAVASVILYDQVPRHVFRMEPAAHIISYFLKTAVALSDECYEAFKEELTPSELVFVLLPLRHTMKHDQVFKAAQRVWDRIKVVDDPIYHRFLKATYSRAPMDQMPCLYVFEPCDKGVLDCAGFEDILAFSSKDAVHMPSGHDCTRGFDVVQNDVAAGIIMSISGGVDSMLASWIMKCLGMPFTCVHINYCNKPTADHDEEFVKMWCAFIGARLVVRRIEEINRVDCMDYDMRDMYEAYTRNVRYNTYKAVGGYVVLGHNKNDCFENILTNITHTTKYENLAGMKPSSVQDGVTFLRPLLHAKKDDIRACARLFGVPHLFDSTPAWSQRGKIRDTVYPAINDWDSRTFEGFFELSKMMSSLYDVMWIQIDQWISRTHENVLNLKNDDEQLVNKLLWKEYLAKVHGVYISNKSMDNLLNKIAEFRTTSSGISNIVLKKGFAINLKHVENGIDIRFIECK